MNPSILRELRMERRCPDMPLSDEDRIAIAPGEYFYVLAKSGDFWRADEDHFERSTGEGSLSGKNRGVNLPPVGVALHGGIEQPQGTLGRVANLPSEQDGPCAGAEHRVLGAILLQSCKEMMLLKEFQDGGGLATWQDESI